MTAYTKQIEALKQAIPLCREGGLESVIPYITHQIRWMVENDYELGPIK